MVVRVPADSPGAITASERLRPSVRARPPASLPQAVLTLQRQAGNRATTLLIQRWFQPSAGSDLPESTSPPGGKKNFGRVKWDYIQKDPKNAYRFVDAGGQGWESVGPKEPFKKSDWNKGAFAWFDATAGRWRNDTPPSTHRLSLMAERPPGVADFQKHGYLTAADVPVYVKKRYRLKPGSERTKGNRPPDLRALDRAARVLSGGLDPAASSPHLATAVLGGALGVAGNTGRRYVTGEEQAGADELLATAVDPTKPLPEGRRAKKDAVKLRAMATGDYGAHHARSAPALAGISQAVALPARWANVGASGGAAEHGELTVLGALLGDMQANRVHAPQPVTVVLGGVKLACGACQLALNIFNQRLAGPLGYRVRVSGTHGTFFPRWQAPRYLWDDANAKEDLKRGIPSGWGFSRDGVLDDKTHSDPDPTYQEPEESESEWEEA